MRLILVLLLCLPCATALEWSEILFNPEGKDNGKEFIELRGTTNLTGCTVHDSTHNDTLELVQAGTDIILIMESDSIHTPEGATIYSAGKAIGNGLGNTGDTITIACETVLLSTSYDTNITGYDVGYSIIYENGWYVGTENGTPGNIPVRQEPAPVTEEPCNTTLALTLSAKEGYPGDVIQFTIVSDTFASYTVEEQGVIISEGDTLTTREHIVVLPATDVKLVAYQRACDAKQRATRYIKVLPQKIEKNTTKEPLAVEPVVLPVPPIIQKQEKAPVPTAHVVVDHDTNVVPWVSGFGIVTILVSAALFFRIRSL